MFSIRRDKIRISKDRKVLFIYVGICIQCCYQDVVRSCMKMIKNFCILFFRSGCDIGSFTNHLICSKFMQGIVEISKNTSKLFLQFFPYAEKMLFLRSFTIDSNCKFREVIIALFECIQCIMQYLIAFIYHRDHAPMNHISRLLVTRQL